jgi:hypothetical protein
MQKAGATVRHAGVDVPFGSSVEVWLQHVGENHLIALTRDQKMRRRRLEREALKTFGAGAFTFTGGEVSAEETAKAICPLLIKLANIFVSEPKPFLYTFWTSGRLMRAVL